MPHKKHLSSLGRIAGSTALLAVLAVSGTAQANAPNPNAFVNPDGEWSNFDVFSVQPQYDVTAVYDSSGDRMIVFGGYLGGTPTNTLITLSLAASPSWFPVIARGQPPDPRAGPASVYDPVRHRMIVIGGANGLGYLNDVWELDLSDIPTWRRLTPSGTPPAGRSYHTLVYDPVGDRIILYGGTLSSTIITGDVWALGLGPSLAWSEITPAGSIPVGRYNHSAIYDPIRRRMIVFGGTTQTGKVNDVLELTLAGVPTWNLVTPSGIEPSPRADHTAIYDPVRDRMLVFGGADFTDPTAQFTWGLSLGPSPTWSQIPTGGLTPAGRSQHAAIYDPVRDRMIVSGGSVFSGPMLDLALDLAGSPTWRDLYAAGVAPSTTGSASSIQSWFDLSRRREVYLETPTSTYTVTRSGWTLALDEPVQWKRFVAVGAPIINSGSFAFPDSARNRAIVFFSADTSTWVVTLRDSFYWTRIFPGGPQPLPTRSGFGRAYDSARQRWIIFGGFANGSTSNQVWALSLVGTPTWSQLTTTGTPPVPRIQPSVAYDPLRDRLIIFGGNDAFWTGSYTHYNDLWALSLAGTPTWTQLSPTGTLPQARSFASLIYDSIRDRMLLAAGFANETVFADLWSLSLGPSPAWTQLHPSGTANSYAPTAFDAVRDRAFTAGPPNYGLVVSVLSFGAAIPPDIACPPDDPSLSGGVHVAYYLLTSHLPGTDTYDFQINSMRNWPSFPLRGRTVISGLSSQYLTVGIPVPDSAAGGGNRLTMHVWRRSDPSLRDSCSHWIGQPTVDEQTAGLPGLRLTLQRVFPNPSPGALWLSFDLPRSAPARVEMFDIAGRRLFSREMTGLEPGSHTVRLSNGRQLPVGMVVLKLTQGKESRTTRAVVLR